jgi:hypothetical protein
MPPGEFEDRQQARREQEMMHARKKVKVYPARPRTHHPRSTILVHVLRPVPP